VAEGPDNASETDIPGNDAQACPFIVPAVATRVSWQGGKATPKSPAQPGRIPIGKQLFTR